jgi:Uma2 family endonuclease
MRPDWPYDSAQPVAPWDGSRTNGRTIQKVHVMATATRLITAEEYARLPDRGVPTELIGGEVVEMNMPSPRHGEVCVNIAFLLREFLKGRNLGRVIGNDGGIITKRNPDSVRGGDVWYISYQKVPKGPVADHYLTVPPDIVFEVLSKDDRWPRVLAKVAEYLAVGVPVVCVVNPRDETVRLYFPDDPEIVLTSADELTFPNQLPGFAVLVQRLFE